MSKFYDAKHILAKGADVTMVVAERSNGKSFSTLTYLLQDYYDSGYVNQFAYIRRKEKHIMGKMALDVWNGIVKQGIIERVTKGEYDAIVYKRPCFYLANTDPDTLKPVADMTKAIAYTFALSITADYTSKEYPYIKHIFFEEFIPKKQENYEPKELDRYLDVTSSIVRTRSDVRIIMMGNTTSMHSIYFGFYGLKKLAKMKEGEVQKSKFVHPDDNSIQLSIIVERAKGFKTLNKKPKPSDKFFLPKEGHNMIVNGDWDIAEYHKLPERFYTGVKTILTYYILFEKEYIRCDLLVKKDEYLIYHKKSNRTETKRNELLFTTDDSVNPYHFVNPLEPIKLNKKLGAISQAYRDNNLAFEDDEVGAIIRQYVKDAYEYDALYL